MVEVFCGFFLWKIKLKSFIVQINKVYRTIKFTAEWSKISINFLDVIVSLIETELIC